MQSLERETVALQDVEIEAAGLRLGRHAPQDVLSGAAPDAHLEAVFVLEGLLQRRDALMLHRRVDHQLAFALGAIDQALRAVGALVDGERGDVRLRERRRLSLQQSRGQSQQPQQSRADRTSS